MSTTKNHPKRVHEGRNVKRFREMIGLKQDAMAYELGGDWSQKKISVLESKEKIEDDILTEIAKVLKIPEEAIRNFDEETAILNINNNFETVASGALVAVGANDNNFSYSDLTINPIEKWVETLDQLKIVLDKNEALYERLLKSEQEKVELLKGKS